MVANLAEISTYVTLQAYFIANVANAQTKRATVITVIVTAVGHHAVYHARSANHLCHTIPTFRGLKCSEHLVRIVEQ